MIFAKYLTISNTHRLKRTPSLLCRGIASLIIVTSSFAYATENLPVKNSLPEQQELDQSITQSLPQSTARSITQSTMHSTIHNATSASHSNTPVVAIENTDDNILQVYGIHSSVKRSLLIKKDSLDIVDAVSMDDIGKFPDGNVAEALQRISGVAISRERGEGRFVSIRGLGPQFANVTVNGRSAIGSEANRAFAFDIISADNITALEVFKTPSADMIEGGIGGTINIRTTRPLDTKARAITALDFAYSDLTQQWDPGLSGFYSTNNHNNFGWLISIAKSDKSLRQDIYQGTGYTLRNLDIGGDGSIDYQQVAVPRGAWFTLADESRDNLNLNSVLQWRPDSKSELNADVLYSKLDTFIREDLIASLIQFAPVADGAQIFDAAEINSDNTATYLSGTWETRPLRRISDRTSKLYVVGINGAREYDRWQLSFDATHSYNDWLNDAGQALLRSRETTTFDSRSNAWVPDLQFSADINSPQTTFRNFYLFKTKNRNKESSFRFDTVYWLNENLQETAGFNQIKIGIRYADRKFKSDSPDLPYFPDGYAGLPIGDFAAPFPVDDFLNHISGNFPRTFILPDYHDLYAATNAGEQTLRPNLPSQYQIQEKTSAFYMNTHFMGKLSKQVSFSGDLGVRVIRTEQQSDGHGVDTIQLNPDNGLLEAGEVTTLSVNQNYTDTLPSSNLRFMLNENTILRLAASKVLTRPGFSDLSPRLSISGFSMTGNAGNPNLKPFTANQFDIAYEWYFAEEGALTLGAFYKDIGSFVAQVAQTENFEGFEFEITRPRNAEGAKVKGLELSYQQIYHFLPQPYSGLGSSFNYTYTESDAKFTNDITQQTFSLEGLSKNNYNIALFYEYQNLSTRLAYNYRGEFLNRSIGSASNSEIIRPYAQLDASISYQLNKRLSISLEANNINNEENIIYSDQADRTRQFAISGRKYSLGLRMDF
ncbi:TonB-dependent receptor [Aliikangiella maris]